MNQNPNILEHCSKLDFQAYSIKDWGEVDKLEHWFRIVRIYSQCRLTKAEDRLVALSGVARYFHQQTGDEYVAGLWRSSFLVVLITSMPKSQITGLHRGLGRLWIINSPQLQWAQDSIYFISILNITVKPSYGDPYGQIEHASVQIHRGPLRRGVVQGKTGRKERKSPI